MRIGASLALLVAGAVLAFAVRDSIDAVDLTVVGYILLAAGALGLVLSLYLNTRSRESIVRSTTADRPGGPVTGERTDHYVDRNPRPTDL